MTFSRLSAFFATATLVFMVACSPHSITLVNNCGTTTTMQLPGIGTYGAGSYKFNQDVRGGIAQACGDINGVGCTSIEFSLVDGVSSADITLIPPHKFDHSARFNLNSGAVGATCSNANCGPNNAFYKSDDYTAQRQVTGPNASIYMQFC